MLQASAQAPRGASQPCCRAPAFAARRSRCRRHAPPTSAVAVPLATSAQPLAPPQPLPVVLPEDLVAPPGAVVPVRRDAARPRADLSAYLRKILTARVYELAVRSRGPPSREGRR